jgi:spore photoproduct lyase
MPDNIQSLILSRFPKFGANKSREISRLVFEISKRENVSPQTITGSIAENFYESVKKVLLKRRYPEAFGKTSLDSFYLPQYCVDKKFKADISQTPFYPKNVYYAKDAGNSELFSKVKSVFPKADFTEIESLKSFLKGKTFSIEDYNKRTENLFILQEKYDYFKKCPCTCGVLNCGYSIMNLGMGCPYECSYCFLQGYQNVPGIILPCNISGYLSDEKISADAKGFFGYKRIGSGEFTDSLVFDDITNFSKKIIPFFRQRNDIYFEFKTKSLNINNMLECGGTQNIVAAWSVNSALMSAENEHKTPDIPQRLNAAKQCAQAGFGAAFHFDPIIPYEQWKSGYKETVDMIFDIVPNESIKWISLGTLRMPAILKPVIENRFPQNRILDGELLLGKDYKLRFDDKIRIEIYKFMNEIIKSKKSSAAVYLCMEESRIWKESGII